ncbi:MAG: pentapeptide repeat-containing protein, partial [bacterium]
MDIIRSNFVDQLAFNEILVLFLTHRQTIYSHPIDFRDANQAGAKLDDADLSRAYLRGTNINLESKAWNVKFCKTVMPDG